MKRTRNPRTNTIATTWGMAHRAESSRKLKWHVISDEAYLRMTKYPDLPKDLDDELPPVDEVDLILVDPASNKGLLTRYLIVSRKVHRGQNWYRLVRIGTELQAASNNVTGPQEQSSPPPIQADRGA